MYRSSSADQIKVRVGEHDFSRGDEKEVHEDIAAEKFFSGYDDSMHFFIILYD